VKEGIVAAVNAGTDAVVYQGHGVPCRLGKQGTLEAGDAARFTRDTFWIQAKCMAGYFKYGSHTVSEALLLNAGSGTVGVVASTGVTGGASRACWPGRWRGRYPARRVPT